MWYDSKRYRLKINRNRRRSAVHGAVTDILKPPSATGRDNNPKTPYRWPFSPLICLNDDVVTAKPQGIHVEKRGGDFGATNDVTIWRIRVECWIRICNTRYFSTATVIRERASILRHTYNVRLVFRYFRQCKLLLRAMYRKIRKKYYKS